VDARTGLGGWGSSGERLSGVQATNKIGIDGDHTQLETGSGAEEGRLVGVNDLKLEPSFELFVCHMELCPPNWADGRPSIWVEGGGGRQ